MPRIVVLGEALIDIFADHGVSLREAKHLHPAPGGAPANVAVAAARLGAEVGFIGKVGRDEFGYMLIDLLSQEGVDTTHFLADPRAPTMLAIVATPSPSEQHFLLYEGASALLAAHELPYDYITSAHVLVYGSVTLASDSGEAALQAAQWARETGRYVFFDVNLRPALWPNLTEAKRQISGSVGLANVLKLNEIELEFLTGTADPVLGSQQLLEQDLELCCISLGANGAFFNNGSAMGFVPAFPVTVRDTTGSGDAFVAGLAYQISRLKQPLTDLKADVLEQMITFANACGALAATQVGAMSASPTLDDVVQLLQKQPRMLDR